MIDRQDIAAAVHYSGGLSRRLFLASAASLATIPTWTSRAAAADRKVVLPDNPFTVGVASGDPNETSVVLWTRLAPKPNDPDGGMPPEPVSVRWELADDEAFAKIVASGESLALPQLGHSVHAIPQGLAPDRWYFYRFRVADAVSPVGRTRTMPAANSMPAQLKFAFASCQHYEHGLYTAYEQMARDGLDLVFHLGDYIYEGYGVDGKVRKHSGPAKTKLLTLADYRSRYVQYRSDPLLSGMHAQCPWFVTWDDHEFDNNYAAGISEKKEFDPVAFLVQRAAAYQAYYEMMPLRPASLPRGPNMQLYRKASFGRLAQFAILDTRQYRTDQPNGDKHSPLNDDALNPQNSLLGAKQRNWLDASLITSPATWNVLAQQVMMGLVNRRDPKAEDQSPVYSMDQWPSASFERMALLRFLADRKVANPVVLTGDIHSNWVNNLRVDDRDPSTPVIATEFVGTSISSGGNSIEPPQGYPELLSNNPCVQFHNRERGYVRCTLTPAAYRSDYVVCTDVLKPHGPLLTRASYTIESHRPGAVKT